MEASEYRVNERLLRQRDGMRRSIAFQQHSKHPLYLSIARNGVRLVDSFRQFTDIPPRTDSYEVVDPETSRNEIGPIPVTLDIDCGVLWRSGQPYTLYVSNSTPRSKSFPPELAHTAPSSAPRRSPPLQTPCSQY